MSKSHRPWIAPGQLNPQPKRQPTHNSGLTIIRLAFAPAPSRKVESKFRPYHVVPALQTTSAGDAMQNTLVRRRAASKSAPRSPRTHWRLFQSCWSVVCSVCSRCQRQHTYKVSIPPRKVQPFKPHLLLPQTQVQANRPALCQCMVVAASMCGEGGRKKRTMCLHMTTTHGCHKPVSIGSPSCVYLCCLGCVPHISLPNVVDAVRCLVWRVCSKKEGVCTEFRFPCFYMCLCTFAPSSEKGCTWFFKVYCHHMVYQQTHRVQGNIVHHTQWTSQTNPTIKSPSRNKQ